MGDNGMGRVRLCEARGLYLPWVTTGWEGCGYVVHGYDDEAAPRDNSLTWVRDASVNMRTGATGKEGIEVGERRLLEVAGMGHGIENALPQIKSKIITFFKLPFVIPEGLE